MQFKGLVLIKIDFVNVCVAKIVALFGNGTYGNVVIHVLLQFNPSVSVAGGPFHWIFLSWLLFPSQGGHGDGAGPEPSCIQVEAGYSPGWVASPWQGPIWAAGGVWSYVCSCGFSPEASASQPTPLPPPHGLHLDVNYSIIPCFILGMVSFAFLHVFFSPNRMCGNLTHAFEIQAIVLPSA